MIERETLTARAAELSGGRSSTPRLSDEGETVSVVLDASGLSHGERDALEERVRAGLLQLPGVLQVRVAMTAERRQISIIAVGSGKGGVGKSTLATNLAVALHKAGRRVGMVDADIHGPSLPRLLGSEGVRPVARDKKLVPVNNEWGVPMLSTGQIAEPGKAIAWRGPMASRALDQLIEAEWGDIDILVIDLPPGTGDIQLSMIQRHKPKGAVIVSTPQDLALIDARRAISLFEQAHVPIIGLVENMAGYVCPHCGEASDPFGTGGAEAAAAEMGLAFLGRVPLAIAIRTASDDGRPPAAGSDVHARPFDAIAARIARWIDATP